jgi:glyoxylase-like metal-dependent hydrolase (beta-lactamase superfamily II)
MTDPEQAAEVAGTPPGDDAPNPPPDPRAGWDLPAFGAMADVEVVEPGVTRVLAPNPSPMTLDGTNTYVLGVAGTGEALVVDPGPAGEAHHDRVRAVLGDLDAEVRAIVLTHHHVDHAEAAAAWAGHHGCPVLARVPALTGADRPLYDGEQLAVAGLEVVVVDTPGHTSDHVALRLGSGAVLTGDHVLGRGTSVVVHPDGDLEAYLASLRRLLDLGPAALHPGHGPSLTEDPTAVLRYYLAHRRFREAQLRHALLAGSATLDELVARLYADVDRSLRPAAAASLAAAVTMLSERGELHLDASGRCHLTG